MFVGVVWFVDKHTQFDIYINLVVDQTLFVGEVLIIQTDFFFLNS